MNFNAITDKEMVRFENLRTQNVLYGQDYLICPLCTIKARFNGANSNKILIIGKRKYTLNDALKCDCGGKFIMTWTKSGKSANLPRMHYKDGLHNSLISIFEFKNPKKQNEKSTKNIGSDSCNSLFS